MHIGRGIGPTSLARILPTLGHRPATSIRSRDGRNTGKEGRLTLHGMDENRVHSRAHGQVAGMKVTG